MKILIWLRNVTSARHFFIFATFAIALLCLYIYVFIFGTEKISLISTAFYGIMSLFVIHLVWILTSLVIHFTNKEWRPTVVKSILLVMYVMLVYFIYGFSKVIFYS